jgi:hypothetical protein
MSNGSQPDDREQPGEPHTPVDPMDRPLGSGIDFTDPNSPLAPYYMRAMDVFAVFILGLVFLLYSSLPLHHTDVWAHLKLGQWIVDHRCLPVHEPFSPYTDQTAPMQNLPWLTQVSYELVFRLGERLGGSDPVKRFLGGAELLREFHVLGMLAVFAFLYLAFRRRSGSAGLGLLGIMLLFAAAVTNIGVHRPQLFGLVGFAALLLMLSRPVLSRRGVWFIPLLTLLWANMHGSFVVGLGLMGMFWLGRLIELVRTPIARLRTVTADPHLRRLTLTTALSVAAAMINPEGPKIFLLAAGFGGNSNLKMLQEWQPMDANDPTTGIILYVVSLALLLFAQSLNARAFSPTEISLTLTFGVVPLVQQRMMIWWLPLAIGIFVTHLGEIRTRWKIPFPSTVPSFRKTVLAVVLFGVCAIPNPALQWLISREPPVPKKVFASATPLEVVSVVANPSLTSDRMKPLAQALKDRFADRPVGPVFTNIEIGELFYWRDIPGCPPLSFTHAHLFTPEYWTACISAVSGDAEWWEFLDRYRVNLMVLEADFCRPLIEQVKKQTAEWDVVVHEQAERGQPIRDRARLFIAIRKTPK